MFFEFAEVVWSDWITFGFPEVEEIGFQLIKHKQDGGCNGDTTSK